MRQKSAVLVTKIQEALPYCESMEELVDMTQISLARIYHLATSHEIDISDIELPKKPFERLKKIKSKPQPKTQHFEQPVNIPKHLKHDQRYVSVENRVQSVYAR